jgi:glycosyltransferase involved in cell wall biosynthesis
VLIWLAGQPRDAILYSRDQFLLWLVGMFYPRRKLVFEAHTASRTPTGRSVARGVIRHAALALAVTRHLADELEALSGSKLLVEHDGIRAGRFEGAPDRLAARGRLNLPAGVFMACYVGQLTTMSMDKGLGTVIQAFGKCDERRPGWGGHLLIVGGPAAAVEALRADWLRLGLPPEAFHAAGQVAAADVPLYLAAADVCLMPQPWTQFFAYYTSPLKLFEYMAAGRPILASDLPSFREVLAEGENALFVPPSDPDALAGALLRLSADTGLQARMGEKNREEIERYTWQARARRISAALEDGLTRSGSHHL